MTALDNFRATFGPEALFELAFGWTPSVIAAIATVLLFWALNWGTTRVMDRVFKRADLDPTASTFVRAMVRLVISVVGGLTALSQLGIDTTSVLTSLGVMGLTIGFAAQNTLSNVISGLFNSGTDPS